MTSAPRGLDQTREVLVELHDIAGAIEEAERTGRIDRLFTDAELKYCGTRLRSLGARLLIKDCVHDFLRENASYPHRDHREVEIENDATGKPLVRLSGRASDAAGSLNIVKILVSLSHSRNWIAALLVFCHSARTGYESRSKEAT
jgi:holo-[acyl-carrier protein] synthase